MDFSSVEGSYLTQAQSILTRTDHDVTRSLHVLTKHGVGSVCVSDGELPFFLLTTVCLSMNLAHYRG